MLKRLFVYGFVIIFCMGVSACAVSKKKDMEAGRDELAGPVYEVTVRTMLREQPTLDADATGVLAPGEEVHLRELSGEQDWALITARGSGDVIFKGWIRTNRISPKGD